MSAIKYNIGDKVLIKDIDWYNKNKNKLGEVLVEYKLFSHGVYTREHARFTKNMSKYCGQILTISEYSSMGYKMQECIDSGEDFDIWTDEMIERLVKEESIIDLTVKGEEVKERIEITIPEGYEYVIESDKIIFTKKKKEYPKTFLGCCEVLGIDTQFCMKYLPHGTFSYRDTLIYNLQELLICRDAYWKIAGDEIGLGKPWEPDWKEERYIIYLNQDHIIGGYREAGCAEHHIFEFPTREMRDAFKENFDSDMEFCKEFL